MTIRAILRVGALALLATLALAMTSGAAQAAKPRPSTHVAINHTVIKLGKTAAISGHVAPNLHGHVVYLQRHSGSKWQSIHHYKLTSKSHFWFSVKPKHAGTQKYRVFDPRTAKGLRSSVSRTLTLTTRAKAKPKPAPKPTRSCTPGYSPCIPPGPDVDCAGGSGNGPRYVQGPIRVTGSDPYGLDADHDGVACES